MEVQATGAEGSPCCSWCRKPQDGVAILVASPWADSRVYICDECIEVCHSVLQEHRNEAQSKQAGSISADRL